MPSISNSKTLVIVIDSEMDSRDSTLEVLQLSGVGYKFQWPCPSCGEQVNLDFNTIDIEDYVHCGDTYLIKFNEV